MSPDVVDIRDGRPADIAAEEAEIAESDVESSTLADSSHGTGSLFQVHLDDFDGPLDLLLSLISKHQLEVTELALHQVTDEFIAYIREQGDDWDLDETSQFLVIAATLLDLKAARLLPSGEVEDEEDLALLEARDLLFARLLQYRAFKDVSAIFGQKILEQTNRMARTAGLDPEFVGLLPDVIFAIGPDRFAAIAAGAMTPKLPDQVGVGHIHAPAVSVAEQMQIVADRLQRDGVCTFRALVQDCTETAVIVGRFLSLLELFRLGHIVLDQMAALGDLHVRWVGPAEDVSSEAADTEFDQPYVAPEDKPKDASAEETEVVTNVSQES